MGMSYKTYLVIFQALVQVIINIVINLINVDVNILHTNLPVGHFLIFMTFSDFLTGFDLTISSVIVMYA